MGKEREKGMKGEREDIGREGEGRSKTSATLVSLKVPLRGGSSREPMEEPEGRPRGPGRGKRAGRIRLVVFRFLQKGFKRLQRPPEGL